MSEVVITIPGTLDTRCRPNARCSERTRKRYRKQFADTATLAIRTAYNERTGFASGAGPLFADECRMHVLVRWEAGRKTWDRDAIITSLKTTVDQLQREGIIGNDRFLHWGEIEQERAFGQPETVITVQEVGR